jgi:hypothetical protein
MVVVNDQKFGWASQGSNPNIPSVTVSMLGSVATVSVVATRWAR